PTAVLCLASGGTKKLTPSYLARTATKSMTTIPIKPNTSFKIF
ncbi:9640_t:CDS:1, partial [Gigaspora margarita]